MILAGSCSYALHVCERECGGIRNSLYGSFWIVLITMPAVGYGDMYAVTLCGRGISMIAALTGVLLVAVITATVYSMLTLMPYESRMVEFLESASARNDLIELAAAVIQKAWINYKSKGLSNYAKTMARRDLVLTIDDFYNARSAVQAADSRYVCDFFFKNK